MEFHRIFRCTEPLDAMHGLHSYCYFADIWRIPSPVEILHIDLWGGIVWGRQISKL
jgi:hypothetical protein